MIAIVAVLLTWPVDAPARSSQWGQLDRQLVAAAQTHADDMARRGTYDHAGYSQRVRVLGPVREVVAVTPAANPLDAYDGCLAAWWRSKAHRAIVSQRYRSYGIAFSKGRDGRYYGCAIFRP